jgi:hypothetical protein
LLLQQNFETHGWSPIVVTVPGVSPPCQAQILQAFETTTKKNDRRVVPEHAIYRQAESGAVGTVEPKESLEVSVNKLGLEDDESDTSRISGWCRALQQVAFQVTNALDLPPNLLLDANATTSLDLMRVFYYHAVDNHDDDPKTPLLGSSPHTDWGSLTVVWQDDVGGLQTYCHACQTYRNVDPSESTTTDEEDETTKHNVWNCIVHVGDVTSLALAATTTSESDDPSSHQMMQWPSPKHRVVSQDRLRTSLVYFGYPPPHLSLEDLRCGLAKWAPKISHCGSNSRSPPMPIALDDYYLLKNQKSTESIVTAATVLQSIQNQPLGKFFADKWNQVQR